MPLDLTQSLLDRVTADGGQWPPTSETADWREVNTYRAILDSDREALKEVADWPTGKPYRVDPLPERIATGWSDFIFGEDPTVTAEADADQQWLDQLVDGDFVSDIREAERRNSGEGEAWWRIYRDEDVADVPLLEWHSRLSVIPYYIGTKLKAAALVTILEGPGRTGNKKAVWRHFEVHADGYVENLVFRGTEGKLGQVAPLADHPETEGIGASLGDAGIWPHGLPMLLGRIYNRRGRRPRLGRSEFVPILDQLLDLNEAASIGSSNMRLTAKKRMTVPESHLTPVDTSTGLGALVDRGDGIMVPTSAPAEFRDEDVIPVSTLDEEMGRSPGDKFQVLEYSFDAEPLIAWKRDLVETALTRIGLVPQWVGVQNGENAGLALSGTALRLRLVPTTLAGKGKAKRWDDALPAILALMAQVDALPVAQGGFDRAWSDPTTPPSLERGDALPNDEVEDAQVEQALVSTGVRSVETSVRRQHPDWSDEQVDEELKRIKADKPKPPTLPRLPPAPGVNPAAPAPRPADNGAAPEPADVSPSA